jgi:tetratricopeptide (TPR) repeat protein
VARKVFLAVVAAILAIGAGLAWSAVRAEREFRRLIAEGERAGAGRRTLEAIEAYSGALALRPDSMVAHLKRGDSYRVRGEYEPALRDLREAATLDPTAPQPVELLADVNALMGRHDRAIELYRQFLSLDERSPRVLYKLALAYYQTHRTPQAIEPLRRALALDERLAEAHYLLGVCLRDQKRTTDGIRSLRRAIALDPNLIPAREALADTYRSSGRYREQLEQLEAIAALEPERPTRIVSIAVAYARAGRVDAAVAALDRLGDEPPDDPLIRTEIARAWLTAAAVKRDPSLIAHARSIVEPMAARDDASGEVLALLGEAQAQAGDLVTAERTLQRAVARVPVGLSAFLDLANAAERLDHLATARGALIDFTSLSDNEDERRRVAVHVAELSLRLGDPVAAARWADRATDDQHATVAGYAAAATAQLALGHLDRAREAVAKGLALAPTHPGLLQLQRRLRQ